MQVHGIMNTYSDNSKKLNIMKIFISRATLSVFVLAMLTMTTASCMESNWEDLTKPEVVSGDKQYASYDIDWSAAADSVSTAFIERFFCSENRNGYKGVFSYSDYNTGEDNGNCYWQQAHAMAAMVEYYNRIKDTDSATAATIEQYFSDWYDARGNNYEGNSEYRGSTGFGNDFTDDTCWIIIALLQMYEATGTTKYYTAAKTTWDECVRPRFAITDSGWLPWKWTNTGPNECTNGPGAIVASMLCSYATAEGKTEEAATYLEEAYTCFDQNLSVMASNGTLSSVPLSYTQGTCVEAGRLIWHLTGDLGYLRKGILAGRGQMTSSSMNVTYDNEYVSRDEGDDENNSIFHAVMFHWITRMIMDTSVDEYDSSIRKELYNYLRRHASYYWTLGIDKSETGWPNSYFGVLCYEARESGEGGSLGAYTSATQAIEAMCLVEDIEF